jgi:acylphosphatase
VQVHGAAEAVEELLRWLHRGPTSARVDQVTELALESEPSLAEASAFQVR